jgi:murein DD-endopeptidase MepM/ murein hydrolase activator NlpD
MPTSTSTTAVPPAGPKGATRRVLPVAPGPTTSWTPHAHHDYPATDIFASTGCGTRLQSPVSGVVLEVLHNTFNPSVNDPATRGGNAVSIRGNDGVRYYMSHFQQVDPSIHAGLRVRAGTFLGLMGETGLAGACHVHFGLSLPCPHEDWWVRRGVIWPDRYLASWKAGGNLSPLPELRQWFAAHPRACDSPSGIPYPIG